MLYQPDAPGDWGQMLESDTIKTTTEMLVTADECNLFLRSWITDSNDVLLILHGLGAHSGWFIDMGNKLASRGLNIYAMGHCGFGRSGGLPGHLDNYHTYIEDINFFLLKSPNPTPNPYYLSLGIAMEAVAPSLLLPNIKTRSATF